MRAELVQARASEAAACEDGEDSLVSMKEVSLARAEAGQLARENAALRETVLALHSELFGARLATKYLDKELAGRIQQLQLLGRDMRAELRDSLWAQVEAEILLQRHKTLVRVCRGLSPRPAAAPPGPSPSAAAGPAPAAPAAAPASARARPRTVRVRRSPHLGLGISVTGGREHGVPILISELEAGGPAALTRALYVGDAILAINDVDLTQACHKEAVAALQSVKGDCALCVQFIANDEDDRLSEDNYRFPLYPPQDATPTAPRTPDYTRNESDDGSGSECESPYRRPPYPDYNSINNNLAILDMDDDSIKIEARLEMVEPPSPPRGPLTPVHAHREKNRQKDWRSRGAYGRVDSHDHVSDSTPSDGLPESPLSPGPASPPGPLITPRPTVSIGPTIPTEPQQDQKTPSGPTLSIAPTLPGRKITPGPTLPPVPTIPGPTRGSEVPTGPLLPELAMPTPTRDSMRGHREKPKTNGEVKPVRRESKGFRIGSARRVGGALSNGDCSPAPAGIGDPDFGTPV
ncbi:uncharacterized protein LOC128670567 isoform X2 [Plodia interpunctella]|nr:uncharacterized protein LOC128670567 isoform X2 [Plodia interpunctella]